MKVKLMQSYRTEADYEGYAPVEIGPEVKSHVSFPECTGGDNTCVGAMYGGDYLEFVLPIRVTKGCTPHVGFASMQPLGVGHE